LAQLSDDKLFVVIQNGIWIKDRMTGFSGFLHC